MTRMEHILAHINEAESLAQGNSCIHRLLAVTKVSLLFAFILLVVSFGRYDVAGLLPMAIFPVVVTALSDIPFHTFFKKIVLALPFVFFVGLSNILFDTSPALVLGTVTVSTGVVAFVCLLLKAALTLWGALLVMSTTELVHLCSGMIQLKVPRVFAVQFLLCYRYIGVLLLETGAMMTAYRLRGGGKGGVRLQHAGSFIGQLLLRSTDRARRIYNAMLCRGFTGDLSLHHNKVDATNLLIIFAGIGVMAAVRFVPVARLIEGIFA